ncbi:hypothetical protein ACLB2K_036537 [Fragaria x ananassa]
MNFDVKASLKRVQLPVHISNLYTGEVATFQLPRRLYPRVAVAIGFSSLTNVYKVFTSLCTGTTGFKFKVFSLGGTSNTWKDVADIDYEDLGLVPHRLNFSEHYLCIHGAIHWMQGFYYKNRPILLVFDVVEERFRVIPLPQDSKNKHGTFRVIEVNGCLAVFNVEVEVCGRTMDFWILKDYQNEVWVREKIMFPVQWWSLGSPRPVCSIHRGEILLSPFRFSNVERKHGSHPPSRKDRKRFNGQSYWEGSIGSGGGVTGGYAGDSSSLMDMAGVACSGSEKLHFGTKLKVDIEVSDSKGDRLPSQERKKSKKLYSGGCSMQLKDEITTVEMGENSNVLESTSTIQFRNKSNSSHGNRENPLQILELRVLLPKV